MRDALIVAAFVVVYALFSWAMLTGGADRPTDVVERPTPAVGRPMVTLADYGIRVPLIGFIGGGQDPRTMTATLEIVNSPALLQIPVMATGPSVYETWREQRASETPMFAQLAREMGLSLTLGVAA